MYLQKNKKGFTLIELMVVVAIIGILALLGLRLYTGQQEKAKNAIVKANAGTIHTLIQAELADKTVTEVSALLTGDDSLFKKAGIRNPYTGTAQTANVASAAEGMVGVALGTGTDAEVFFITGYGASGTPLPDVLTARR